MPNELALELTLGGAPHDGAPVEVVVLDTLRGTPERSMHSVRMQLD
jgi:hypothetical protein